MSDIAHFLIACGLIVFVGYVAALVLFPAPIVSDPVEHEPPSDRVSLEDEARRAPF